MKKLNLFCCLLLAVTLLTGCSRQDKPAKSEPDGVIPTAIPQVTTHPGASDGEIMNDLERGMDGLKDDVQDGMDGARRDMREARDKLMR